MRSLLYNVLIFLHLNAELIYVRIVASRSENVLKLGFSHLHRGHISYCIQGSYWTLSFSVAVRYITPTSSPLLDVTPSHSVDAGAELLEEIEEFNHWNYTVTCRPLLGNELANAFPRRYDSETQTTPRC
jgi:hypothetical protein